MYEVQSREDINNLRKNEDTACKFQFEKEKLKKRLVKNVCSEGKITRRKEITKEGSKEGHNLNF
jgi:hypothetical protein